MPPRRRGVARFPEDAMPIKSTTLHVGDNAPDFDLQAADGTRYTLKQYLGKSALVLIFIRGTW